MLVPLDPSLRSSRIERYLIPCRDFKNRTARTERKGKNGLDDPIGPASDLFIARKWSILMAAIKAPRWLDEILTSYLKLLRLPDHR
ncbi:hypothetical protein KFK09_019186 [Dendrobium nobile]|uniref:Uncharacterized protein n=1 Tax=Dendrobium nobile TaxID=94219 RepID=A0A8T3AYD4_DENNO|nr:hypothetical protein KFK09_019186 [Dendrobium nobile]